jgi:D-alanyl-D-alanine carboxypeptidase
MPLGAMRAKLALLAALAALPAVTGGASSAGASPPDVSRLQQALDDVVAAGVPGAIALVRDGGRTIRLASGYANLAPRTPMRATDRFRIASETKTFVATVVLQLVGERKLALEETIERRLPGLVPNGRHITVRQLLNHTSGLFEYAEDNAFLAAQLKHRTKAWRPRQLIAVGTAHKALFAPGARWSYSNTGYIVLGLIVEKATGHALGVELRKRIFERLHLRSTTFDTRPQIAGRHAHGYSRFGQRRLYDVSVISPTLFWAAGAIVSTADDLARFHDALLGGRLLRRDLLAAMKTTVKVSPGQRYGLGIIKSRLPCSTFWGHGGGTFGYELFADSTASGTRHVVVALTADESVRTARIGRAIDGLRSIAYCA